MPEKRLPLSFYNSCDTVSLAQKLLGCELVHESGEGTASGIIVETEAYLCDDPACHAYNRRTARTEPMYAPAGTAYVYLIYGMYQCFNVVSNQPGIGEAVLIRALEPVSGIELMQKRRLAKSSSAHIAGTNLCSGPGKLVTALGISRDLHNNTLLTEGPLYIRQSVLPCFDTVITTRIGITVGAELPYRFYIKDNRFVSRPLGKPLSREKPFLPE